MLGPRSELPVMQSDFYRNCYRKISNALVVSVVIMLVLIAIIIYYVFFQLPPPYYATTTTGQIIPMAPATNH